MKHPDDKLVTPIYIKSRADLPWPADEAAFYVLSRDGLFLCRNHPFFQSCVPAPHCPSELSSQGSFLRLRYPRVPRKLFETIVGFFDRIGQLHGSEAGVLLAWDRTAQRIKLIIPEQRATVSRSWTGSLYPLDLHYEVPTNLPAGWTMIGDVHSHVNEPAYASATDRNDETYRAGLHIVVGRLYREPPDVHIEAVVDGTRFSVDPAQVLEGYVKRRLRVPQAWIERVRVEPPPRKNSTYFTTDTYRTGSAGSYPSTGYGMTYSDSLRRNRSNQAPRFADDDGSANGPQSARDEGNSLDSRGDKP